MAEDAKRRHSKNKGEKQLKQSLKERSDAEGNKGEDHVDSHWDDHSHSPDQELSIEQYEHSVTMDTTEDMYSDQPPASEDEECEEEEDEEPPIPAEQRLMIKLLRNYERSVRPVKNASDTVAFKMGLTLTQIFDMVSTLLLFCFSHKALFIILQFA